MSRGMSVQSELAYNSEKKGEKVSRSSNVTSGHWRRQIYDRERCEKKLGDGEPGGGGGGGFGRIDLVPPRYSVSF